MRSQLRFKCAAALAALSVAATAGAQVVGPGTNLADNNGTDTAGGRINIDQSVAPTLPAGQYTATLFNFDAGIAGDVTPFLAFRPNAADDDTYQVLAVGATQSVAGAAQDQSVPFGGSATFTLPAATQLFAGIASSQQNPIILDDGVPSTDHEGGGQPAGSYIVTVGGTVPTDGAISNPDLGRVYAFSVNVQLVPEPTALGLIGVGVVGLLRRRR